METKQKRILLINPEPGDLVILSDIGFYSLISDWDIEKINSQYIKNNNTDLPFVFLKSKTEYFTRFGDLVFADIILGQQKFILQFAFENEIFKHDLGLSLIPINKHKNHFGNDFNVKDFVLEYNKIINSISR